jgi:hypothetical protein
MIKHVLSILLLVLGGGMWSAAASAQTGQPKPDAARQTDLAAVVATVRGDIRATKTALINQTMQFNDAEMKVFWPVYREFEAKLTALNDQRLKLIDSYVDASTTITDKDADAMVAKALDLESKRTALKKEYYERLKKSLPVKTAVKALAIEQQISMLLDLEVASEVSMRPIK